MNASACPAAPACGNVNTNNNNSAPTQSADAEKGQSTDFSKVMDKAKSVPETGDSASASTKDTAKASADKPADASKKAAGKPHDTGSHTAAVGTDGNPLPPWLPVLPPSVAAAATTASQKTPPAAAAQAADAAKLPGVAEIAAGISRAASTLLTGGGGRNVGKVAADAKGTGTSAAATGANTGQTDTLLAGVLQEGSPMLVLAKPGDGAHAALTGNTAPSGEFLNALNSMLTSADGSANGNAAHAARADLLSAHAAGQSQAAGNGNASTTGNAAPAGASIPVPVQNPQWSDAFAARVVWQAGQDLQQAHLHLNPPELGPIDVKLDISNDKVNAQFVTHHLETRQAIQDAIPRLREMMSQSGMNLMNANVFQQGQGHNGQPAPYAPSAGAMSAVPDEFDHGMQATAAAPVRVGLVDAYA